MVNNMEKPIEFIGGKIYFFVVIKIIPLFDFWEEMVLEMGLDDGGNLQ